MAYTLNYSGGTISISDGTINSTNTSLAIPGRNYTGYGSPVDQNLVSMLENFAFYTSSPPNAVRGQLWFDITLNLLKYNIGVVGSPNWVAVAGIGNDVTFNNITATGDVTVDGSLSADSIIANTISANSNLSTGVQVGINATGINQVGAFAITKDINVIASSTAGVADGVRLPANMGGYRITIVNLDNTDAVKVYPFAAGQINSLGASAPFSLAARARLDFVSISNSQWYTLNSTYG